MTFKSKIADLVHELHSEIMILRERMRDAEVNIQELKDQVAMLKIESKYR